MRILVSTPAFDGHMDMGTGKAGGVMCRTHVADFLPVHGYDVASARNYMANYALDGGYDYLMMVDSDTVPPPGALGMLLESGAPVAVGTYAYALNPSLTVASRLDAEDPMRYDEARLIPCAEAVAYGGARVRIGCSGLGCALVDVGVFRKIGAPWFRWVTYESGEELGEDCHFAEQCRLAGIEMVLDSRVLCDHMKPQALKVGGAR